MALHKIWVLKQLNRLHEYIISNQIPVGLGSSVGWAPARLTYVCKRSVRPSSRPADSKKFPSVRNKPTITVLWDFYLRAKFVIIIILSYSWILTRTHCLLSEVYSRPYIIGPHNIFSSQILAYTLTMDSPLFHAYPILLHLCIIIIIITYYLSWIKPDVILTI